MTRAFGGRAMRMPGLRLICTLLALAAFAPVAEAASSHVTIEVDGVKRSALIVERERLKRGRRPVILVLHGSNGNGARVRRNFELDEAAGAGGAIVVYPDAYHDFDRANLSLHAIGGAADAALPEHGHVGTDPEARADSQKRVAEWLAR